MSEVVSQAPSPFDDPEADIVLSTSDNVSFRVHRSILRLSSSFFNTMFSLPQPSPNTKASPVETDDSQIPPEIPVSEDSNTLRIVLSFCYPVAYPTFKDLSEVKLVIGALMKYDMHEVANSRVKPFLEPFIRKEPLRMFAVAYHHGWKEVVEDAARELLRHPVDDKYVEELELITAGTFHRVFAYHKRCGEAASDVTSNLRWIDAQTVLSRRWFTCPSCRGAPQSTVLSDGNAYPVRLWFTNYLTAMGDELSKCPASDTPARISYLSQHLQANAACNECRMNAISELSEFAAGMFASRVKEAISAVDFGLRL